MEPRQGAGEKGKPRGRARAFRLERFEAGQEVNPALLMSKGLVRGRSDGVKVLGTGALTKSLSVRAHKFSRSAVAKIEAAGGKVQVIERD
jgi:large subunit ribosomal protein L15